MSKQLIARSEDLRRLRNEGFDIEVKDGYLLAKDVPYVDGQRNVRRGTLVSELTTAGDLTGPPKDHVIDFAGDTPCDVQGKPLEKIINSSGVRQLTPTLAVTHRFSSKPVPDGRYADYYDKITAYSAILESYAQALAPGV